MVKARSTQRSSARLGFDNGHVRVKPKDRTALLVWAERAEEARQEAVLAEERIERFEADLLLPLHQWCLAHAEQVRACYVAVPCNQIRVFIVSAGKAFDCDMATEIAALEMVLFRRGWRISVMQLPDMGKESLAGFVDPRKALEVYAKRRSAPKKGGH